MTTSEHSSPASIARLSDLVDGRVVLPGDDDWAQSAQAWNLAIPQQPAAVVHVAHAEDVASVVRFAAERGLPVTVQPGGHGATTAVDGAILIRPAALDELSIDTEARIARVGAGVKWGAVQAALDGTGLVGLAGSSPDVSVVGYCVGGGHSWFSRAYGTGAASIRAVEIVDATGQLRWVDDSSDPDLLWALRGGGGEFALVTTVEVALADAPVLTGGRLMFPAAQLDDVWRAFVEATATVPRELTLFASVVHFPPIPEVPEEVRGQSFCLVDAVLLGDESRMDELLAPLRAAGTVIRDTVRPLQPGTLGGVADEPLDPVGALNVGSTVAGLDGELFDALVALAADPASGLMQVQIRHLGGALRDAPAVPSATGSIAAEYVVVGLAMAPVPPAVPPAAAALRRLMDVLAPWEAGPATITMLADGDSLERAFDPATLDRLRQVKTAVDPRGVLRGNFPVAG